MRRWCLAAGAVAVLLLALAAGGAALLFRGGISARTEPTAFEARLARALRHWAIPAPARAARNPVPAGPEAIAAGLAHFADHCATCHANDGSGNTPMGRKLYPRAPDMRRPETQRLSDGELFHIIESGVRFTGMPAWGGDGSAQESWQLVHFIRRLPALTAEERQRMEALNPRSPAEAEEREEEESFLRGEEPAPRARGGEDRGHRH
ncbi:MAG TPA: cytochrome c [Candidatus Limnocylindria bacterium]|nr:cytochrome c [Candidatus Limnocylindria bacterium]